MKNTAVSCYKKFAVLLLTAVMLFVMAGCGTSEKIEIEDTGKMLYTDAALKPDGTPYRIAFMDEDPPIESSYQWISGLCERLQMLGYISSDIDLSQAPDDYEGYFRFITSQDLGGMLEIDDEYYMITDDNQDYLEKSIRTKVENGDLDLIAVTGTMPGKFLKSLSLPIPVLVSFASDPVASGIITSADDTGDENVWALVEELAYARQFDVYTHTLNLNKVGIITSDRYDEVAGDQEITEEAEKLGVTLVKEFVSSDTMLESREKAEESLKNAAESLMDQDVQAVMVLLGVMDGSEVSPEYLTDILAEKDIPYLISDGEDLVREGGMLLISYYDYSGYGDHVADVMNNIFHGEKAGDQPTKYDSSPKILLNMTTAEKLNFKTGFRFLQTVDEIYY